MIFPELTYKIRGIAYDIFNNVIGDWNENVYEEIFLNSLKDNALKVKQQIVFEIFYKDKRVGLYRTDLIVEDKIILELKVVSEIFALHKAQVISYLKVTGLPLGLLINFGSAKLSINTFPNIVSDKKVLNTNFDIKKINLSSKQIATIEPYLLMSKEILEILGPGYFHQVYRRAFLEELKFDEIDFEFIKELELNYKGRFYGKQEVRFFKINDLLISIVAVNSLNDIVLNRFSKYVKYYKCSNGLIVNFNNTIVDFKFL